MAVKGAKTAAEMAVGAERLAQIALKSAKVLEKIKFGLRGVVRVGTKADEAVDEIIETANKLKNAATELPKVKPKNSPDVAKWKAKGGKVEVLEDGTWRYTDSEGNIVNYKNGYPDFEPYERQRTEIEDLQGNHSTDFSKADKNAPKGIKLDENTWHHNEDMKTMQEVPKKIHRKFTHRGGVSGIKKKK